MMLHLAYDRAAAAGAMFRDISPLQLHPRLELRGADEGRHRAVGRKSHPLCGLAIIAARPAFYCLRRSRNVAQADILIADERLLPQAVEIYNSVFRPKRELDFFKRRFTGRYNSLTLLARMDNKPVGFWVGFELKPGMFYHWLGGVTADLRRHGVGRQLQEAQQAWAKDHGYEYVRCECMNHQREFIHFAVALGFDIVGIRWDSTHADNLIVFEKNLVD
jgi:GNAT superfamily N-acetyltransferase